MGDVFAIHLSSAGIIQWRNIYGGSDFETGYSIQQGIQGESIIIGYSSSSDGDLGGPGLGHADVWVLTISESGDLMGQHRYGTTLNDFGYDIGMDMDGHMLVLALTPIADGDVTVNHGFDDYWLAKLGADGGILWQNGYGGSDIDTPQSMSPAMDGGYILVGYTSSSDGNVTGYHGGFSDGWVVKVDSVGGLQWQKVLGGTAWDLLQGVVQTEDGGYVVVGQSASNDGDVSGNHGGADGWAVKLDAEGNLVWQRTLGGSGNDQLNSVVATADRGFVAVGATNSSDGDVSYNLGGFDGWVVKLDSLGNLQWDLPLGGSGTDNLSCVRQADDGGFLLGGYSTSNDGQATGNHGMQDMWVVKLGPEPTGIPERPAALTLAVFPNPAVDVVHLQYALRSAGPVRLEVLNGTGQPALSPVEHRALPGLQSLEFNAGALPPGVYRLRLVTGEGMVSKSLVKLR